MTGFKVKYTEAPPFPKEGFCLNLLDDYILECLLPEAISKHFLYFFQTVTSLNEFNPEMFFDVFTMRARFKLSICR